MKDYSGSCEMCGADLSGGPETELAALRAELAAMTARAERADLEATERACKAMCWMCKDVGNWFPAEQTPEEFMDENQPPIWGHRPRPHHDTEWAFKTCDAEKIHRAAAQAKGGE